MMSNLQTGNTASCGCLHREQLAERNRVTATHGAASGGRITPLYRAWQAICARCLSSTHAAYRHYGGRGITVHEPWQTSFVEFRDYVEEHLGDKPSQAHSLDRIDNEKGYVPGNLRWATASQQVRNRRDYARRWQLDGKEHTLAEWAEIYDCPLDRLVRRIHAGWGLRAALTLPRYARRTSSKDSLKRTNERQRLRSIHRAICARCHDPKHPRYKDYGGRGITVCARWRESFDAFFTDVVTLLGQRPARYTFDRIDNNRGYSPDNVQWASYVDQARNRRTTTRFKLAGEEHTLARWADIAGIPYRVVHRRMQEYGWPLNEALGTPVMFGRIPVTARRKWRP